MINIQTLLEPQKLDYSSLPDWLINLIYNDRDIGFDQDLDNLDSIFPSWKDDILKTPPDKLVCLTDCQIILYLMVHGFTLVKQKVKREHLIEAFLLNHYFHDPDFDIRYSYAKLESVRVFLTAILKTSNVTKDLPPLHEIKEFRYNQPYITRISNIEKSKYKSYIKKIYGLNSNDPIPLDLDCHELERYYFLLDSENPLNIAQKLGIVFPKKNLNKKLYLTRNIWRCKKHIDRPRNFELLSLEKLIRVKARRKYLDQVSDKEVLTLIDGFLPFATKKNLRDRVSKLLKSGECFFYPFSRKRAINLETLSLNRVDNPDVFMIAYGNFQSYYVYELEDFISAFYIDKLGDTRLRNPLFPDQTFTDQQIEELLQLLDYFPRIEDTSIVKRNIENIQNYLRFEDKAHKELISMLDNLSASLKTQVQDFFLLLIECGMLMRGWDSKSKYPLKEKETFKQVNHLLLSSSLLKVGEYFERIPLLKKVRYLENCDDEIKYQGNIFHIYEEVINDKLCIRVTSKHLLITASFYLKNIFGTLVPFNVTEIENIA